jgi:hypothetical protein
MARLETFYRTIPVAPVKQIRIDLSLEEAEMLYVVLLGIKLYPSGATFYLRRDLGDELQRNKHDDF